MDRTAILWVLCPKTIALAYARPQCSHLVRFQWICRTGDQPADTALGHCAFLVRTGFCEQLLEPSGMLPVSPFLILLSAPFPGAPCASEPLLPTSLLAPPLLLQLVRAPVAPACVLTAPLSRSALASGPPCDALHTLLQPQCRGQRPHARAPRMSRAGRPLQSFHRVRQSPQGRNTSCLASPENAPSGMSFHG